MNVVVSQQHKTRIDYNNIALYKQTISSVFNHFPEYAPMPVRSAQIGKIEKEELETIIWD